MRTAEVKKFIDDHQELFWYTPKPKSENVTDELLVEIMLNYGSMDELDEFFNVMNIKTVSKIFYDVINRSERCRGNYYPEIYNYFDLYFKKYVS
jgi:hypothetical protein